MTGESLLHRNDGDIAPTRTIVADPPWPFEWQGGSGGRRANATTLGYKTLTYDHIAALAEGAAWHKHATLLLWVTQDALHRGEGRRTALAWGFPHRIGELIWRKPNFGAGAYPRISHETCLIYRRGVGSLRAEAPRNVHSVQEWSQVYGRGNGGKLHSAKPDGFYDWVEAGFHGRYLEMFARRARLGQWSYFGDESLQTAEVAA